MNARQHWVRGLTIGSAVLLAAPIGTLAYALFLAFTVQGGHPSPALVAAVVALAVGLIVPVIGVSASVGAVALARPAASSRAWRIAGIHAVIFAIAYGTARYMGWQRPQEIVVLAIRTLTQ